MTATQRRRTRRTRQQARELKCASLALADGEETNRNTRPDIEE